MDADQIMDVLTAAGALAMLALPVAMLIIAVLVVLERRRARAIKEWAAGYTKLKRRLHDVEAIRQRERAPLPPDGWEIIMEAAELFRTYQAHHRARTDALASTAASAQSVAESHAKEERNAAMALKLERLLSRTPGLIRTRRLEGIGTDGLPYAKEVPEIARVKVSKRLDEREVAALHRPAHGGYLGDEVPETIRRHLGDPPFTGTGQLAPEYRAAMGDLEGRN